MINYNSRHKGFLVLMSCLSYFEAVEQYKTGQSSRGNSKEIFTNSIQKIYPNQFTPQVIAKLYDQGRCGLFHDGMVKGQIIINYTYKKSIVFTDSDIKINPRKMLSDIVEDVKRTVNTAIEKAKLKSKVKPRLLSDNGPCYISNELKTYLKEDLKMKQVHGRPMHPQTQGKIERYHRTMKNVVKLNHFYHPEELIEALEIFVNNYNTNRYHESLNNLTPAVVYFGRSEQILEKRKQIKEHSIKKRRQLYNQQKLINL